MNTTQSVMMYVVQPGVKSWFEHGWHPEGHFLPSGSRSASDNNPKRLIVYQIREMVAPFEGRLVNAYAEE